MLARSERTRASILAAAETLFAERGFAETRLEDVAAAVGIRRASIVYYFADKPALYDAVLADVFGGLLARIEPVLNGAGALAERAITAVSTWIDYVAARPVDRAHPVARGRGRSRRSRAAAACGTRARSTS